MRQPIHAQNDIDEDGNPTGGYVTGVGIKIEWQKGPLGREPDRLPQNGAFVEGVIDAALQRIEFYQLSKFACAENAAALSHLKQAMDHLLSRTNRREAEGIEGTHAESPAA